MPIALTLYPALAITAFIVVIIYGKQAYHLIKSDELLSEKSALLIGIVVVFAGISIEAAYWFIAKTSPELYKLLSTSIFAIIANSLITIGAIIHISVWLNIKYGRHMLDKLIMFVLIIWALSIYITTYYIN